MPRPLLLTLSPTLERTLPQGVYDAVHRLADGCWCKDVSAGHASGSVHNECQHAASALVALRRARKHGGVAIRCWHGRLRKPTWRPVPAGRQAELERRATPPTGGRSLDGLEREAGGILEVEQQHQTARS